MRITSTHVYFYTNCFSNWWTTRNISPQFKDPLTGIVFNNTEEAFMWYKAHFFGDTDTCTRIETHVAVRGHPRDVKAFGREVCGFDENAWACVREGFMTYVNLLKYQQNDDLRAQLIETGNRTLVEASPIDLVWGVGYAETDDLILDEHNWRGQNLLGKALMTVRGMIR